MWKMQVGTWYRKNVPKQYITFNPMQYVVMRHKKDDLDLFAEETDTENGKVKPLSFEQYQKLIAQLGNI